MPDEPSEEKVPPSATLAPTGQAPTIQIHAKPPDDHWIYGYIGQVANAWARFERVLDIIIWNLSKIEYAKGACFTANYAGVYPKFNVIKTMASLL